MNPTPFAWAIMEDGICIVITRREKDKDEWVKEGCEAWPLYLENEVPSP